MSDTAPPVVAAFDLDGTLTSGGSVFKWLGAVAGRRDVNRAALRLAGPLLVGAIRSGTSADNAKERLFRTLLAGRDAEDVRDESTRFGLEHLDAHVRPEVLERLTWHLGQGHVVVVISASAELYVSVIAERLGAHGAIGTRLAVDPRDKLTGGYLGKNCRGAEKLRRFEEWVAARPLVSYPVVFAYGNSRGDRRLLAHATNPVNVGHLGVLGSLRRFPRLRPVAAVTADESTD